MECGLQSIGHEPCTDPHARRRTDAEILRMQVDTGQSQEIQARDLRLAEEVAWDQGRWAGFGRAEREDRLLRKRKCL